MNFTLSMAPIQGITDYYFRNVFHKHFGDIDKYYAPYLRADKEKLFTKAKQKDVIPENNRGIPLIPQIMVNNSEDFLRLATYLENLGYTELNWNLGCPYPMVTNRKLGAGLLPHHELILSILDEILPKIKAKISIKLRSGLEDNKQLHQLLPKLNPYPLSEIIIHPRFARQLYKEQADLDLFMKCMPLSNHRIGYNGDINSSKIFQNYRSKIPLIKSFMLGRGVITNPFLAEQIKSTKSVIEAKKTDRFFDFHDDLFAAVLERFDQPIQAVTRMKSYWEYFSQNFINSKKVYKPIKKANSISKYENAIFHIALNEEWIG